MKCSICGKKFKKVLISQKVCLDCLKKQGTGDIQSPPTKP